MKTIGFLMFMGLCCLPSFASSDPVLLVTGEVSPFTSEKLEGHGFITEIVVLALKQAGIDHHYEFYPWKRCENMVENGSAWAAFPYSYNKTRATKFLFSDTVGMSTTRFFYYKTQPVSDYETLLDLKAYKIGGVLGYFYVEIFKEAGIELDLADQEIQSMRMLAAGRIDLLPLNELVGWGLIKKHFPVERKNFGTLEKALRKSELKLMISKDYPNSRGLLKRFNTALKEVQKIPDYQAVLEKYGIEYQ